MTSLQESQAQLQHTQDALTEQYEKTLRLSQKLTALRRLHRKNQQNQEGHAGVASQLNQEEPGKDEEEGDEDGDGDEYKTESLNKSQMFSYQTPGLEILQCKYRVAVTEVVELKAEMKILREKLAQCGDGAVGEKPTRKADLQRLEQKVASLEKSCLEGREKVSVPEPSALHACHKIDS